MAEWEDYIIDGTKTLKNNFNITSSEELKKLEKEIVVSKLSYLYINGMPGNFDIKHLCDLHQFLFGDIYPFAGKYREVDMYKITGFEHWEEINHKLEEFFEKMNNREVNESNKFEIAKYLADYYYELIGIHPFREGNGRTTREFLRQFTSHRFPMYELDYTKIDKKNFQIGVVAFDRYPLLLAYEIYNALVPVEKEKKARI